MLSRAWLGGDWDIRGNWHRVQWQLERRGEMLG